MIKTSPYLRKLKALMLLFFFQTELAFMSLQQQKNYF